MLFIFRNINFYTMANKTTQTAGLTFNVNTVRNKLKEFYESQGHPTPMFSGGQSSITGILQKTFELILRECMKHVGKDRSGVRQINRDFLVHSVLLHNGFKQYFSFQLDSGFNQNQMYGDQVPISRAEMDKVMETVDKDLSLSPKARNLICFLLLEVFIDMAHTCSQMLDFAKRKALDARCAMFAVSSRFPENISFELKGEIVRVAKAFGDELEDNSVSSDTSEEVKPVSVPVQTTVEEQDTGEEVQETQTKKKVTSKDAPKTQETGKKPAVKTTKAKQIDEEVVEDQEEEEVAEEVIEVQPKKTQNTTKPGVKTTTAPSSNATKNNVKTVKK